MGLFGCTTSEQLREVRRIWVEASLKEEMTRRDSAGTESLAIGRPSFVNQIKESLGTKARHREVLEQEEAHVLRESAAAYIPHLEQEKGILSSENTII